MGSRALVLCHPDVRQAQELQHAVFRSPDCAQLVIGPTALHFAGHLVIGNQLARPATRSKQADEHFDGGGIVLGGIVHVLHSHGRGNAGGRVFRTMTQGMNGMEPGWQSPMMERLGRTGQTCAKPVQRSLGIAENIYLTG